MRFHRSARDPRGFTLVELAVALMVIGLLIGGVLQGMEMVANARVARAAKDITDFRTATRMFITTYDAFPGDVLDAANVLPDCTGRCADQSITNGDKLLVYHHDQSIPYYSAQTTSPIDRHLYWIHLAKAGLIEGNFNMTTSATYQDFSPPSPIKRAGYHVHYYGNTIHAPADAVSAPVMPNNWLDFGNVDGSNTAAGLTAKQAAGIDMKLDDGKPYSGSVRMMWIWKTTRNDNCVISTETEYNMGGKGRYCNLATELPQ